MFGCREYNQSDFGIDHLVTSMCRVVSYVVGRGSFLWPMCSFGKTLLLKLCFTLLNRQNFALFNFVVKDQICLLLQVSLDFLLLHSSPLWWKGHLLGGISSKSSCRCSQNHSTSASSALVIEAQTWITVKLNSLPWKQTDNILSFYRLQTSTTFPSLMLTMRATPFPLRDSCLWSRYNGHLNLIHPFSFILVYWFLKCWYLLLPSPVWSLPIYLDSWT